MPQLVSLLLVITSAHAYSQPRAALAVGAPRSAKPSHAPPTREGFALKLETGWGEKIDTYNGKVTKDMVSGRDITIPLVLSKQDLDRLYFEAFGQRLFDLPEPHPPYVSRSELVPNTWVRLKVTAGAATKRFAWEDRRVTEPAGDWKRLYRFIRALRQIVESKPEYQALPPPRGLPAQSFPSATEP